jgi:FtsP/CotA-like multicopper oxidase with cupredoxin domain
MWTHGGTFPGPTIRRPTGQTTKVTFTNNLDPAIDKMSVHNHGNHSPLNDGRLSEYLIGSGAFNTYTYDHIDDGQNERGAPQFYHDHMHDVTARNVWMGLAGFYILDDPADPQTLPAGARDIPLALMDRTFDAQNQIPYTFDPNGVVGDRILVNGRYQPYLEVDDAKDRFRVLNGSNTRVYNLVLSGDQPLDFTQIGTGAGLLPAPVTGAELRVGPGERRDVVVGFAPYQAGETLHLTDINSNPPVEILQFRVASDNAADNSTVPGTLRPLPDIGEPTVTRAFNFGKTGNH